MDGDGDSKPNAEVLGQKVVEIVFNQSVLLIPDRKLESHASHSLNWFSLLNFHIWGVFRWSVIQILWGPWMRWSLSLKSSWKPWIQRLLWSMTWWQPFKTNATLHLCSATSWYLIQNIDVQNMNHIKQVYIYIYIWDYMSIWIYTGDSIRVTE